METNVTMSLERFRQLESAERTLNEIKESPERVFISQWEGYYSIPRDEASIKLSEDFKSLEETAEKWRKEVVSNRPVVKRTWF